MHRMKRIAQAHMLRDVEWHSLNCALTYATLGIWKPHMKGKVDAVESPSGDISVHVPSLKGVRLRSARSAPGGAVGCRGGCQRRGSLARAQSSRGG
jgi:hypothetical protein